ncbi:MAG: dihydrolipoamide acetyltransferase family protein [Caldilineaceae bacterium]
MDKRTLQLPSLGEGVTQASIAGILVSVGDRVAAGQPLIEVETDKVTVEVPADVAGTVETIHVVVGDDIQAGDAFVTLAIADSAQAEAQPPASTVDASIDASLDAEKAEAQAAAPTPETDSPLTTVPPLSPTPPENPPFQRPPGKSIPASPVSRRMARELGIDIGDVQGSGFRGRISAADVKAHARHLLSERPAVGEAAAAHLPLPDISAFGPVQRQPLNRIGQVTAANMQRSWSEVPHAWLQEEVDITELEAARQRHKARVAETGGALTLTAILVRALAGALAEFPLFNAVLDAEKNEVVLREYIHIGVAMDTERGLLVPVLRDVANKSLLQISQALAELTGKARQNRLGMDDLQGAGFTLSNLGGLGLTGITPIVNWPQVAILGVAGGRELPRYVNGKVRPRLMLPLTLGFDHRLINGADAARFLAHLRETLADPFLLALR